MAGGIEDFLRNPYYREILENSPTKQCREWLEKSLVGGAYCGTDPNNPKTEWEKDLTADDWRYILNSIGGNTRLEPKCLKKIAELEAKNK